MRLSKRQALLSITIPESVDVLGEGAFSDCISLTSIVFPKDTKRINEYTFSGCEALTKVTLPRDTMVEADAFDGKERINFNYI